VKSKTLFALLKFLAIGSLGLCITLASTYLLTDFFHLWYFWSYLIATIIAWTFVFFANALFTFAVYGRSLLAWSRYVKFILGYLMVFWIGAGTVYFLTSFLFVPYLISIIIGTMATTSLTFTISKFIIFVHAREG